MRYLVQRESSFGYVDLAITWWQAAWSKSRVYTLDVQSTRC